MEAVTIIAKRLGCDSKEVRPAAMVVLYKMLSGSVPINQLVINEADIKNYLIENGKISQKPKLALVEQAPRKEHNS